MKVLGIDPGIERLGWGVIKKTSEGIERINSGVKRTSKIHTKEQRLLEILEFLEGLIAKERPRVLSLEKIFFSKNTKTALTIGEVRGVVLALAAKHHLEVKEFAPLTVKAAVTGFGGASKEGVANILRLSMKLPSHKLLDDETDALAVALCGIYSK